MSLGVLNNLSAVYAENNLTNTNNSLSKTLQQLSSGSRINSGADDAAGLSMVDGLQANQMALTQSQTNAQEGVGLLQVADGALSQVTNLLDRAVTLATEVSNGTLNGSQNAAANQEYNSIMSEIDNIGSTTTYNQNKVFGFGTVGIYAGDSSTTGASLDNLNIAQLSRTSVGDGGGAMGYNGGKNVFLDLSNGVAEAGNAQSTDTVASTTLTVSYDNPDGSTGNVVTTAATTVNALMAAINASGRGLTATFTTASQAGASPTVTATDTGIMISGNVAAGAGSANVSGQQGIAVTTGGYDTTATGVNAGGKDLTSDNSGGIAQITYTAGAGTNIAAHDVSGQTAAEATLTTLNAAIANVASQDGYIGAQINTLNSVSNVLATQQQNVQSAQNAVQATDYAAASSNMSKYEILSQTGIAALAQANSLQQEVTKLLQ
ncbi:MAG TPA: flagellin [Terracidiphilus sp.]|jgi:flagellin|nr:flagellin [Terracidiphilus sp.]